MNTSKAHRPKVRSPKIGRHASGQAYVTLAGHRHYLGRYDDPAAHEKGHRLIAEYLANGKRLRVEPKSVIVTELVAAYLTHCKATYRRQDSTPNDETVWNIVRALDTAKALYGSTLAAEFGPNALRACLAQWRASGKRRTTVNKRLKVKVKVPRPGSRLLIRTATTSSHCPNCSA